MAALFAVNAVCPPSYAQVQNWNTGAKERAESLNSQALNVLTKGPFLMGNIQGRPAKVDNLDVAMHLLLDATRADPTDPRPFENLGLAMDMKGRYQEALDALTQAYKLAPTAVETTLSIGLTHYLAHNYDKAITIWQRLIKYDPKLYQVNACVGMAQMHVGDFDHAAESFHSMLKYYPDSQLAFQGLATINYLRGDLVNARGAAERAQQIRRYPPVTLLLAELDFLEGKNDSGKKRLVEYARLLTLMAQAKIPTQRPMTSMGYSLQHEFHWDPFLAEDFDNASFVAARWLDLPKNISKQKQLCRVGRIEKTAELLGQRLVENPQDLWSLHEAGIIELSSGEYLDAADKLGRVIGMNPNFGVELLYIGRALKLAGRDKEASAAVREYMGLHGGQKLSPIFINIAQVDPTAGPAKVDEMQAQPQPQPNPQTQPPPLTDQIPKPEIPGVTTPGVKPENPPPPANTGF